MWQTLRGFETYPHNLLAEIRGNRVMDVPTTLTKDACAGIEYALFLLDEKEREVLIKKYRLGQALMETELEAEKKALKKMRHPCRWEYICHGVVGNARRKAEEARREGYTLGYRAGYEDGINRKSAEAANQLSVMDMPIETMPLSSRVCNVLRRYKCKCIRDVSEQKRKDIIKMRSFGVKGIREVVIALHAYGIFNTDWDKI